MFYGGNNHFECYIILALKLNLPNLNKIHKETRQMMVCPWSFYWLVFLGLSEQMFYLFFLFFIFLKRSIFIGKSIII